jgi:predicted transcriptional regulator
MESMEIAMSTAKDDLTRIVQAQPEDSSPEEIIRELAFHVMVEKGLADVDAKRTITNEEMARRIRSWQK